jgi:hypothetical protein
MLVCNLPPDSRTPDIGSVVFCDLQGFSTV